MCRQLGVNIRAVDSMLTYHGVDPVLPLGRALPLAAASRVCVADEAGVARNQNNICLRVYRDQQGLRRKTTAKSV